MCEINADNSLTFALTPMSENTLYIQFFHNNNDTASPYLCQKLALCTQQLTLSFAKVIYDCVPSYTSLLIYYDFTKISATYFSQLVEKKLQEIISTESSQLPTKKIEIPVYYAEETGPDLPSLAKDKGLSIAQVIQLHSETKYTVYAMGFAPGFIYLGFVHESLQTYRLSKPRDKVAKGSVGIADRQTGIYPCDSPGGWKIIGKTPLEIFDQRKKLHERSPFHVGDTVCFSPIARETFIAMGGEL